MKISGYRQILRYRSVTVAAREWIEMQFDTVLPLHLASDEVLPPPGVAKSLWRAASTANGLQDNLDRKFTVAGDNGEEHELSGAIFYGSITDLVSFLAERYVPKGPTPLDMLVQRLRDDHGSPVRSEIEALVAH